MSILSELSRLSGMLGCVAGEINDVWEEPATCISGLKVEAADCFEVSVRFNHNTRSHFPEVTGLHASIRDLRKTSSPRTNIKKKLKHAIW